MVNYLFLPAVVTSLRQREKLSKMCATEDFKSHAALDLVSINPTSRHPTFQPGLSIGYSPDTTVLFCLRTFARASPPARKVQSRPVLKMRRSWAGLKRAS